MWFEPRDGEFLALYTYREKINDLLDSKCGGDTKKQGDLEYSGRENLHAIMFPSNKSTKEKMREWNALKGEDVEWFRVTQDVLSSLDGISTDQWNEEFQSGPGTEGSAMMVMEK